MKRAPALAIIEFGEVPTGIYATDAMLKKSPIAFVRSGTITRGRYLTVIGGSPASVEESAAEGLARGGSCVIDHLVLADVHPAVWEAMMGERRTAGGGALAIVETDTVATTVRVAELALKGTPVELVEIRMADGGLSGKGIGIYRGELHDVEAALEIVLAWLPAGSGGIRHTVVSAPHEALARQLAAGSAFGVAALLDLDGEAL